ARFGGEEFSILLPETPADQALEIAERIRRAVASKLFEVETSSEPIRATISMGVASYPRDGHDANELVHQADLAVYRAKLQGRNRVLDASDESLLSQPDRHTARLIPLPAVAVQPPARVAPPAAVEPPPVQPSARSWQPRSSVRAQRCRSRSPCLRSRGARAARASITTSSTSGSFRSRRSRPRRSSRSTSPVRSAPASSSPRASWRASPTSSS